MNLRVFSLIAVGAAVLVASCSTAPVQDTRSPKAARELASALAGRTAGPPVRCLPGFRTSQMQVVDDWTILYRDGRTTYVQNPRGGCRGIANGSYTMVIRQYGTNQQCDGDIVQLVDLRSGMGGPSQTKVKRFYEDFEYQAQSWDKLRRVIAKIEWHPGELFPRVGFIVTNLPMEPDWVVRFYNQRGTAEQHIKEGKYAFRWTRLSCKRFRDNEVRLQLHALAYNLATFLRCIELPEAMADWSLTSLQLKLIKIGARVVRHARAITFQLAEVAVTGAMVRAILAAIRRLRAPPLSA